MSRTVWLKTKSSIQKKTDRALAEADFKVFKSSEEIICFYG